MTLHDILLLLAGFAAATLFWVVIVFGYLKRRWKYMLFGLGSKLFGKVKAANEGRNREVGRM